MDDFSDIDSLEECKDTLMNLLSYFFDNIINVVKYIEKKYGEETIFYMKGSSLIALGRDIVMGMDANILIEHYKVYILPMKKEIYQKNEKFFLESNSLFFNMPNEVIVFLRKLWMRKENEGGLNKNDKCVIWDYSLKIVDVVSHYEKLQQQNK